MKQTVLFFRSLIFYIGYVSTVAVYACLCLVIGPLLPLSKRYPFFLVWPRFVLWWLRICCGIRIRVTGAANVPDPPFVLVSNHQSPWETFFLYARFPPISAILKKSLLYIPLFGWSLAMLKPIAIDRSNPRQGFRLLMQKGKQTLEEGRSVMVFPEGTRVNPGEHKAYSSGGAALAIDAGVPLLPLAHNAGRFWPARRFLKYPGTVDVVIGAPIDPSGYTVRQLSAEAETWIRRVTP